MVTLGTCCYTEVTLLIIQSGFYAIEINLGLELVAVILRIADHLIKVTINTEVPL